MFLVGAGCSASAGIPLASQVAQQAIIGLAKTYEIASVRSTSAVDALEALIESEKVPSRFKQADGVVPWGELYSYIFSEHIKHPNDQRALITRLVNTENFELNWSHACLGELVQKRYVHTVLTTNFDQLVLKGIIRTGIIPVVADGLESLSRISATPRNPQVVHLHGSMHTYELRNSYVALRETEHDRGLQAMMLGILKETTVLVVIGYSGGEEGIMSLLQDAAQSLPRMVVYWIAYESDYARLSRRAKEFLEVGEHKFFILNQESDDFFNQLIGELGIGPPSWIKRPLEILQSQVKIKFSRSTSDDVARLIKAYEDRVAFAVENGTSPESLEIKATELRSGNKFKEAVEAIEQDPSYGERDEALRIHAYSLFNYFNKSPNPSVDLLKRSIAELTLLVGRKSRIVADTEKLIEAQRDYAETLLDEDEERLPLLQAIALEAELAQCHADVASRQWAVMEFYQAEGKQLEAEAIKRSNIGSNEDRGAQRLSLLTASRNFYLAALPILAKTDSERARECKEGLAGALSALSELEVDDAKALSHLREAKTLFQDVVDTTKRNTPGREYAGALENLAGVVEIIAGRFPAEAQNSRDEQRQLLLTALKIYVAIDDVSNSIRMRGLLDS
jgi:hypothetical protein